MPLVSVVGALLWLCTKFTTREGDCTLSTVAHNYIVRRWRGFVDPTDLPTAVLLLASGARFQEHVDLMPNSPSATEVYYDAAHCNDSWPFARPDDDLMQWLNITDANGAVLDVFEVTHTSSDKRGVFVTLSIGEDKNSTPIRNTPALTISGNRVSVSDDTIALFASTTDTTKMQRDRETALSLLTPIFGSDEGISPYVGIDSVVPWANIAHNKAVTTRALADDTNRFALNGFSDDRSVYINARDPLWTANPCARGADLHFDNQTRHGIFTQFVLNVHDD